MCTHYLNKKRAMLAVDQLMIDSELALIELRQYASVITPITIDTRKLWRAALLTRLVNFGALMVGMFSVFGVLVLGSML